MTATNSKALIFILALLVIFCPLGIDLYLPAFVDMQASLEVSENKIQQTVSIYMLAVGLGQLIAGPLADKYGRKPISLIGISLFAIGAVMASSVSTWSLMMVARVLQGLGACATFVSAFAIVRDSFGHKGSGQMITYLNGIVCFIPALAPILGAWLTVEFGWQSNFSFLAGFALVGLLLIILLYKETRPEDTHYSGHILDLRRFTPMLNSSTFVYNAMLTMLGMAAMLVFVISAPGWIMAKMGGSVSDFTFWFTGNAIFSIAASFIAPHFIKRNSQKSLTFGLSISCTSGVILLLLPQTDIMHFVLPMYLASIGFAFTIGAAAGKALSGFAKQAGTASALIGVLQMSGGGLLATMSQPLALKAPTQLAMHLLLALPFLALLVTKHRHQLHSAT
ncbi:multidrug effflux MFS transporter [Pseudoalteromonas peptidolytica]|uniref:Bcr/CflA family efflux transporter n=1 Tax=Pseudoalteromonas peptidolytica F12-50-A1 TaxID=1315280 RepID=A0A8I0MTX6_9GAMM|nr:multidrug effflux MFS transporter [Pseudoalteromonas peptidolytica]MBE0345368.1 MFS transporter, DHA1 family, bicyclomycin/chloramphenicol resistance protein [Pseudoalteromonas peptidolytica F12-50-A1]NLR15915.1 multidrug effflux MFS transporter [Pseudoalteromonas peptidolytica]GEK11204.1 Bcr/CflA family drug resistance efflux transporter [Pseudoalteromonas peptidolytica]